MRASRRSPAASASNPRCGDMATAEGPLPPTRFGAFVGPFHDLRGETVSHKADWFRLEDARLQLLPFNPDGIEVGVASTFSPAGATLAGRLGLSLLSVAATDPTGFDNLDVNWGVCEKVAHDHGQTVERKRWRVVASM